MTPCPRDLALGISYYPSLRNRPKMRLAVLIMYDCYPKHDELRTITKRNVIVTVTERNECFLLLLETKTGKKLGVLVRVKLVHKLFLRKLRQMETLGGKAFLFSQMIFKEHSRDHERSFYVARRLY